MRELRMSPMVLFPISESQGRRKLVSFIVVSKGGTKFSVAKVNVVGRDREGGSSGGE